MKSIRRLFVAVLAALAGPGSLLAGPPGPEVIYFNGVVRRMESSAALPDQALAIDEGDIAAVGSNAAVLALAATHTRLIDLGGRTLLPGFVDAHTHAFNGAADLGWSLSEAQDRVLAAGITSLGNLWADADFVGEMQAFDSSGNLKVRTSLYLRQNGPCGVSFGNWYASYTPNRDPRAMLRLLGVKIFADGGSCNYPAISFPYADPTISPPEGNLYFTRESLLSALRPAHDLGWQIAVHAIGDRARDIVFAAFDDLLLGAANLNRHRIEHNTLIRPDQIDRYGQIGLIPVIWGRSQTCRELGPDGWRDELGPARQDWYHPWRSLLAHNPGLQVAWHMDLPHGSAGPAVQLRTFEHLYGLVTRRERRPDGSFCAPPLDMSMQRVGLWQALRMMSLDAAYALHQDTFLGTLSVGKLADLIVVSGDPFAVDPNDLDGLRVLSTVVGGRARYCAPGSEALCGF